MQDSLLTIITRLHRADDQSMDLLGKMLLSLAGSTHSTIQPLIVTQCFSAHEQRKVKESCEAFVWHDGCVPQMINFVHPEARDHRAALLNLGIKSARGRFIAFLDYDDYVYEHAYETLIGRLRRCTSAVAFGGCMAAYPVLTPHGYKVTEKARPWAGRTLDDFLTENIFPPVSYVIDREKLGGRLPMIDERLTRLEDYYLLLKLRALATFDLTCFETPLCEYVIRKDGTTTFQLGAELDTEDNRLAWKTARDLIAPLRQSLQCLRGRPDDILPRPRIVPDLELQTA